MYFSFIFLFSSKFKYQSVCRRRLLNQITFGLLMLFSIDNVLMVLLFSLGGPIHSNCIRDIRGGQGHSRS